MIVGKELKVLTKDYSGSSGHYELKGRLYLEKVLSEDLSKAFELDLEDLKPGLYLLQIQNAEGEFYSERVVKL